MIDTHAHLDMCADPDAAVARARAAGVTRILTVGIAADSWRRSLELAVRHDGVYAVLGVHPHNAARARADDVAELRDLLRDERAVAVGETGLDFYRDYAPHPVQRQVFEAELELASALALPVVVHSRAADRETADLLAAFDGTVVLHCFSSPGLLPAALERGYYVSFAGNVTYPKAGDLREVAARVPADRILAETDSPYLSPQPVRGRPNEPANVVHTLATLADVRGERASELERRVETNAATAFALR